MKLNNDLLLLGGAVAALLFLNKQGQLFTGSNDAAVSMGSIAASGGTIPQSAPANTQPTVRLTASDTPTISTAPAAPAQPATSGSPPRSFNLGITPSQVVIPTTSAGTSPSPVVFLNGAQTAALYSQSGALSTYTGPPVAGYSISGYVPFIPQTGTAGGIPGTTTSSGGGGGTAYSGGSAGHSIGGGVF